MVRIGRSVTTRVAVVGDGPDGLSAPLFTAKDDLETAVFDVDETGMHRAHPFDCLGIESRDGTRFLEIAREQVDGYDADVRLSERVTGASRTADRFRSTTDDGGYDAVCVIFATETDRDLGEDLGCETTDEGTIAVDIGTETSVATAHAVDVTARAGK